MSEFLIFGGTLLGSLIGVIAAIRKHNAMEEIKEMRRENHYGQRDE